MLRLLLTPFRRRPPQPTKPHPNDHITAATAPPKVEEDHQPTPLPPAPPEPSQPLPPGPAWPSPRTWVDAAFTEADAAREKQQLVRLAALTERLGSPLAAAQHLYAPHLPRDNGHRRHP